MDFPLNWLGVILCCVASIMGGVMGFAIIGFLTGFDKKEMALFLVGAVLVVFVMFYFF